MLNDILSVRKGEFASGTHTELRGQLNRSRRVTLLSGSVVGNARSDISGISARVYKNGVYGFSSMADYTPEAAAKVLHAASEGLVEKIAQDARADKLTELRTVSRNGNAICYLCI